MADKKVEFRGSAPADAAPPPKKKKAQYNTFRDNPSAAPAKAAPPPVKPAAQPGGLFGPLMKVLQSK